MSHSCAVYVDTWAHRGTQTSTVKLSTWNKTGTGKQRPGFHTDSYDVINASTANKRVFNTKYSITTGVYYTGI